MALPIPDDLVESILLGPIDDRRQLQDSPILGDVWLAYAAEPAGKQDLLITPYQTVSAGTVAKAIKDGLKRRAGKRKRDKAGIAYLNGVLAVRLDFEEVLHLLVPRTQWWHERKIREELAEQFDQAGKIESLIDEILKASKVGGKGRGRLPARDDFNSLQRYVALAGLISWARTARATTAREPSADKVIDQARKNVGEIAGGLRKMFGEIIEEIDTQGGLGKLVFQVSLNRRAFPALARSVPAVKGDAAHTVFEIDCSKIVWAVVDSGIEKDHPAFLGQATEDSEPTSRIRETYDFTRIREIVSGEISNSELKQVAKENKFDLTEAKKDIEKIVEDADAERPINWALAEKFISVKNLKEPSSHHGTHVAGIIGAHGKDLEHADGMCPDIILLDFRVLAHSLQDTEFAVIAALQFIRHLNERNTSYQKVHGVNLSLSIPHSVRNYACGRTPVCNECERLVDSGVVVVAAAGNHGYQKFETKTGVFESYASLSITDPGNAHGVITVGATHGHAPHTYGVSFFSSRGPTGDGRMKPDLVAPGERIESSIPGHGWAQESGTSMSAPHVSGAAAMLMARYPELVGNPRRIKRVLCDSATDLGRERNFQGSGLLDVLRAFQSI